MVAGLGRKVFDKCFAQTHSTYLKPASPRGSYINVEAFKKFTKCEINRGLGNLWKIACFLALLSPGQRDSKLTLQVVSV